MEGVIRSLNHTKQSVDGKPTFGFIRADDGEEFFFIPASMQQYTTRFDELTAGMRVSFTAIDGNRTGKGRRAIEVKVIGGAHPSSVGPASTPTGRDRG